MCLKGILRTQSHKPICGCASGFAVAAENLMALFSGRIGVSRRNFIANHLPWNCKGEGREQKGGELEPAESSTRWCQYLRNCMGSLLWCPMHG